MKMPAATAEFGEEGHPGPVPAGHLKDFVASFVANFVDKAPDKARDKDGETPGLSPA